ncbi:DUF2804 family protein [Nonomuraea sp. NPDC049421]|uniref:DUF2804 family protein n=1 Tax=Nonomuraea sp. NPDC049421 TaxID=3155275 RepID=UPI0034170E2B
MLDRATGEEHAKDVVAPLARKTVLPERSGTGRVSARAAGLAVDLAQEQGGSTIRAVTAQAEVDLEVPLPEGHESLGVVVPWEPRRFQGWAEEARQRW